MEAAFYHTRHERERAKDNGSRQQYFQRMDGWMDGWVA